MPKIRSSADLRNNYNDISTFCHTYAEPVFIPKNGKGDLAVMSIETYEDLAGRKGGDVRHKEGFQEDLRFIASSGEVWTMLPPDVPSLWMRQWLS